MKQYDYLIVGAGLYGAVFAQEAKKAGKKWDLKPGMVLSGTVRNVIDFGAFVDIGVHRDGLVHISQMAQRRVNHPSEVVRVGDIVTVWVLEADAKTNRISLTMRPPAKG